MTTRGPEKNEPGRKMKALKIFFRVIGVILFVFYLSCAMHPAWMWMKLKWIRSQPLENITFAADRSIYAGNPKILSDWISLRPKEDHARIMALMEPYSGRISSMNFLYYASWKKKLENKPDEAAFWYQYAMFRLRFDALRCGSATGVESMNALLARLPLQELRGEFDENPGLAMKMIPKVLEYDAKYPAENFPIDTCQLLQTRGLKYEMVPYTEWRAIRHTLRTVSEYGYNTMKKKSGTP